MADHQGTTLLTPAFNSPYAGSLGCLLFTYIGGAASGDTITFNGDPTAYLPSGAIPISSQLLVPGSTASLTASVGYAARDGDVTTTGATNTTYFNSATAVATAGRFNETSLIAPIAIPKSAWPVVTIGGAAAPSATYTLRVFFLYPGPTAANR